MGDWSVFGLCRMFDGKFLFGRVDQFLATKPATATSARTDAPMPSPKMVVKARNIVLRMDPI